MSEENEHICCPSHCCRLHGCKYGYGDCPVVAGKSQQEYLCERCGEENIRSMEEFEAYIELQDITPSMKITALGMGLVQIEYLRSLTHANYTNKSLRLMHLWMKQQETKANRESEEW